MLKLIFAAIVGGYVARHLTIEEQKRRARVEKIRKFITNAFK